MTNETQHPTHADAKPSPFGARLKAAREALGLERKDAAAQLRLNEKIIIMMEKDRYPADLPVTFIRGYLRSYGKLLQLSDHEINRAIEPIKPKLHTHHALPTLAATNTASAGQYFMPLFTSLIILTLIGLVGTWWYSHNNNDMTNSESTFAEQSLPIAAPKETITPQQAIQVAAATTASAQQNPVDNAPKISNDTVKSATTVASSKKITKKPVIPDEHASEEEEEEETEVSNDHVD